MGELVPEPVRVKAFDTSLQSPTLHHLAHSAVSHWSEATEP
jgi:hypothetical protein